ncbi:MAG: DUF4062 domain-containing protein [Gemmatimonadetes bacterium]|nr:DUF4062 domain-containing protein [Gemmatimonadota bacterium]
METKHQVFVSSTFKDLVQERQAVIHALLELDCIPAGMELFPAADEDAWSLIRSVIDDCDYYILVIAGKYGSTNSSGVSFTEMEFDYAVSINKPILAFLHENPDALPAGNVDKSEPLLQRLDAFREKAKSRHCKFWTSPEDLGGKVSRSLVQLRKRHPSAGWIPGKYAASDAMLRELQELRARVAELELEAVVAKAKDDVDLSALSQGADKVPLALNLRQPGGGAKRTVLSVSWDTLLSYFGPSMLTECTDEEMMGRVRLAYFHAVPDELREHNPLTGIILPSVFEDKIRVQFQALGFVAPGVKRRAVADNSRYWRLTPRGEKHLLSVRAERRPTAAVAPAAPAE